MKPNRRLPAFLLSFKSNLVVTLLTASVAGAANLTWDPLSLGTGSDGGGTWNNSATPPLVFSNGGTDVAYTPTTVTPTTAATAAGTNTITLSPAAAALLSVGQLVSSAAFPAGATIASINPGTGVVTMSANATGTGNVINSGTSLTFVPNDTVIFGKGTGAAGTVAVSGNQGAANMTINAAGSGNYLFTGGTITLGSGNATNGVLTVNSSATINSGLITKSVSFGAAGQTLSLGGGSTSFLNNGASGTSTNGLTSRINLTAGSYVQGGGSTTINIGNATTGTGGLVVNTGASYTTSATFQAGSSGTGVVALNGGTITQANGNSVVGRGAGSVGRFVLTSGTYNHSSTGSLLVGFSGATGTLDVQGSVALNINGALSLNSPSNSAADGAGGTAIVNLSGTSVTTATGVIFGKATDFAGVATSGSGTLNVDGGSLYVGATGIVNNGIGTYSNAINLSGGIVGAKASWTSSLPMTLTNTNGGVTFKAADAANASQNIGLSGVLSGAGNLTKTGGGILTLSAANNYTGATAINGGTLTLDATGTIDNTSGVSLAAGTLNVTAKGVPGYTVNNLSGNGNVTGALSVSTQLSAGGAVAGTIAFSSNLTLVGGSTYLFDVNGGTTNADLINVAGNLNLAASPVLDLVQLGTFTAGQKFTLAGYTGALTGTFNGYADDAIFSDAGGLWKIDYNDTSAGLNGGTGTNFVTITAVIPEPSALLLGSLGLLGAALRRRR